VRPLEDTTAVAVMPGTVGRCDMVIEYAPSVFVKLCDPQGAVVRTYDLLYEYIIEDGQSGYGGSSMTKARPDADGWHRIDSWITSRRGTRLSLRAKSPDSLSAATNDLQLTGARDHYITLMAVTSASQGVCGFLYTADDEPLMDVHVSGTWGADQQQLGYAQTDHLGFFELPGSTAPTSMLVRLHAYHVRRSYTTNVYERAEPIVWVLEAGRTLAGRVCIEHAGRPATNFHVGMDMHNSQRFSDQQGRFTLYPHEQAPTAGVLYAWVDDYAPGMKPYTLSPRGQTDVGDIIVAPAACAAQGRIVNERGEPLSASAVLHSHPGEEYLTSATSGAQDGAYAFTRLPTGTYQVAAHKSGASDVPRSTPFVLTTGQTYDVPDLVIVMSNTAYVRLVFVMADDTPAAHLQVSHANAVTDAQGAIEDYVRFGRHENWTLYGRNEQYFAEAFDVTPGTRDVRVTLLPADVIEGTVTLDGAPLPRGALKFIATPHRSYGGFARNGVFSFKGMPGRYIVACAEHHLVTIAALAAGANNHLSFISGTAALRVSMPHAGRWYAGLQLDFEAQSVQLANQHIRDADELTFDRLPAGTYKLYCYGGTGDSTTNMTHTLQLGSGQQAHVRF